MELFLTSFLEAVEEELVFGELDATFPPEKKAATKLVLSDSGWESFL